MKILEQILHEAFTEQLQEDEAVALTAVLNQYNIFLSRESPCNVTNPIELTLEAATLLVSKLSIQSTISEINQKTWHRFWNEKYLDLYNKLEFQTIIDSIVKRLLSHKWVERLE